MKKHVSPYQDRTKVVPHDYQYFVVGGHTVLLPIDEQGRPISCEPPATEASTVPEGIIDLAFEEVTPVAPRSLPMGYVMLGVAGFAGGSLLYYLPPITVLMEQIVDVAMNMLLLVLILFLVVVVIPKLALRALASKKPPVTERRTKVASSSVSKQTTIINNYFSSKTSHHE